MRARGSETEESLQIRLQLAHEDDQAVRQNLHLFNCVIENDDNKPFDEVYEEFVGAIDNEITAASEQRARDVEIESIADLAIAV